MLRSGGRDVWVRVRHLVYLFAAVLLTACGGSNNDDPSTPTPPAPPAPPPPTPYTMSKLVSDGSVAAVTTDALLKNPWGIVFAPNAPVWIANNATQSSTLYDGTGKALPVIVTINAGTNGDADVTGIVANPATTDFIVTNGTLTGPSRFIFAGEGGTITAWAPTVDATHALVSYDDAAGGAIYTGLAVATEGTTNRLYAADFHNKKVDVFDREFKKTTVTGGFTDTTLPANYAPFGIQAVQIGGTTRIVVTYAQRPAAGDDEVTGAGLGLVNVFDVQGTLVTHLVPTGGKLNAPWGVAIAPASYGTLSNALLVGNFGDGVINGYDATTGAFVGTLADSNGTAIASPGLWGIAFGNGARNQPTTTLYFAAGVGGETGGLYGRIDLGATAPDIAAPTVSLTAPAAGATVSGTVQLTTDAADNVGVASVEYRAGTVLISKVTTAPFAANWDTTTAANGNVSLTAIASDAAGNSTTSAAVAVVVSNVAAPPPPPPPPPPAAKTLTELQAAYFGPICSGCHSGNGNSLPGVMNLTSAANSYAALVNVASIERAELMRVKPNDSANSYIVHKLKGQDIQGSRMPLGGPFFTDAQIADVVGWIDAGALNN